MRICWVSNSCTKITDRYRYDVKPNISNLDHQQDCDAYRPACAYCHLPEGFLAGQVNRRNCIRLKILKIKLENNKKLLLFYLQPKRIYFLRP